jgi:RNA polymerase sigma factor (sigma-70 family)
MWFTWFNADVKIAQRAEQDRDAWALVPVRLRIRRSGQGVKKNAQVMQRFRNFGVLCMNRIRSVSDWNEIIRRCRNGDARAQADAYRLTWRLVFPSVFRVLRNREEAEDIMQEAYIKGFLKLRELRDPERYPGWQKQIAVRQAVNRLRQIRPEWSLGSDRDVAEEEPVEWEHCDAELLREAIECLPPGYRMVVELHVMEEMSHEEIGDALGIRASTARSQYSRAIRKLKQHVTAHANS